MTLITEHAMSFFVPAGHNSQAPVKRQMRSTVVPGMGFHEPPGTETQNYSCPTSTHTISCDKKGSFKGILSFINSSELKRGNVVPIFKTNISDKEDIVGFFQIVSKDDQTNFHHHAGTRSLVCWAKKLFNGKR